MFHGFKIFKRYIVTQEVSANQLILTIRFVSCWLFDQNIRFKLIMISTLRNPNYKNQNPYTGICSKYNKMLLLEINNFAIMFNILNCICKKNAFKMLRFFLRLNEWFKSIFFNNIYQWVLFKLSIKLIHFI